MKKMILVSIVFLMLFASMAYAAASLDVSWQAATDTLRPGSETSISLTVTNTGTTDLTNVVITPSGGPYIITTSGKIELGGIPAGGSNQGSVSIRADSTAESRTSYVYLKVEYYTGTASNVKSFTIPIYIRREPILQIVNVNYDDVISPGKTITINFDIKNSGLGPAKDLIISLDQSSKVFTIPESAGELVIDTVGQDDVKTVGFVITIDPEADVGINSVPVVLKYYDETKSNL
ncbi:MAG: hypothetical protein PHU12_02110, partial [Candidatus Aenigmarchaeota archaeon]|nr:hypothetical protein [Candidatus Aenigmarchaeota archaeon]